MKAVKFKNFSDTDFTWDYDGVSHTFPAQSEILLEDFKAEHFAKHLIDRELTRQNILTNNTGERNKLHVLCFPPADPVEPSDALVVGEPKKRKAKKAEPEFEDLHVTPKT